jgi:hypothetical protein
MNRFFTLNVFVVALFFGESAFSQQTDSLLNQINTITIEEILALPEDKIDIGLADLVLAKDFYPDLKIESFLYAFNYMADRYNYFFGQHTDPDRRVRALNTFLYKKGEWNDSITFGYDDDDLHVKKLSNKFINGYIATKKGSCITLPMILEPDFSAFQVPIERLIPETKNPRQNQPVPRPNPPTQFPVNPELQTSLAEITTRYVPLIQAKLEVYEKYKQRAEELGIVRDYPESFFRISSTSLKQFQEKGVK